MSLDELLSDFAEDRQLSAGTGFDLVEPAWAGAREQTMATVNRVANACVARRYAQMAQDLQPASLTIHDLTAQVTSHLSGA